MKLLACFVLAVAFAVFFFRPGSVKTKQAADAIVASTVVPITSLPLPLTRAGTPPSATRRHPAPAPVEKESPPPLDLTADQESSLSDAKAREDDWAKESESFIRKGLGLSPDQVEALERLRSQTIAQEEQLVQKPVSSREEAETVRAELRANRRHYERELARVLGASGASEYRTFYRQYWGLRADQPLSSPHLPL